MHAFPDTVNRLQQAGPLAVAPGGGLKLKCVYVLRSPTAKSISNEDLGSNLRTPEKGEQ
jgi:hypothetical protein